jgi:RNA polymerase sigma factor (sigma-70 family)
MKRKQFTDQMIISGILENKKEVLSFLYEYNFESLNKKVVKEGGNRKDSEDVFHDALLILFLKIKDGELQLTCSLHTFLQAIARNLWKKKIEERLHKQIINDETHNILLEELNLEEEFKHLERRKLYLKHLADMPEDCQRLIRLILEGLSLQEITEVMHYNSIEFTKTKRFRCKVMLMNKIINDPLYKDLKNERLGTSGTIPRW